jgi:hypothetical protein
MTVYCQPERPSFPIVLQGGPQSATPAKEMVMQYQTMPLRNEDLPPTKPANSLDDHRAFTIGAWAGVCFALALLSAAAVILVRSPESPRSGEQAWAPTITLPSRN